MDFKGTLLGIYLRGFEERSEGHLVSFWESKGISKRSEGNPILNLTEIERKAKGIPFGNLKEIEGKVPCWDL